MASSEPTGVVDLGASTEAVAAAYDLGTPYGPMTLAAVGEQGKIWRLDSTRGAFAVKELVMEQTEDQVAHDVAFQEHVVERATSFEVASTLRTNEGSVLTRISGRQVRVQTW